MQQLAEKNMCKGGKERKGKERIKSNLEAGIRREREQVGMVRCVGKKWLEKEENQNVSSKPCENLEHHIKTEQWN